MRNKNTVIHNSLTWTWSKTAPLFQGFPFWWPNKLFSSSPLSLFSKATGFAWIVFWWHPRLWMWYWHRRWICKVVNMHEVLQGLSTDYILYIINLLLLSKMSPVNVCWFGKISIPFWIGELFPPLFFSWRLLQVNSCRNGWTFPVAPYIVTAANC